MNILYQPVKGMAAPILIMVGACLLLFACGNDKLDIKQDYAFDLVTLPVKKRIAQGETLEIRCQIIKEGNYTNNRFHIRYFQSDGRGSLCLDDGRELLPNDLYMLPNETFRMYYTSGCREQQSISVVIIDSFGQEIERVFSWQNENVEE